MDVIYLDELFALNLLADYLLLLSGASLRGAPLRRGRFALGAALGAVYAALSVLPGLSFLRSGLAALAASGLMALLAYGGAPGFFRSWLAFALLSAAYAGAVYACALLSGQGGRTAVVNVPLKTLLLTFGVFYAAQRLLLSRTGQKRRRQRAAVRITLLGRSVECVALRDTGNTLCDAVTGLHVLIAERRALAPLLPEGFPPPDTDAAGALRALASVDPQLAARFRLLPYRAVGTEGLLLCFRPDAVWVDGERAPLLIGLSPTPFADGGEYQAIV